MNKLETYFRQNTGRLIHKWDHYFDVYDRHFSRFIGKEVIILEIGISQGGSLQMWKEYFGKGARIYGIDIDPRCKELEEENITIFIGSQEDRQFLKDVVSKIPKLDILLDDGGHNMRQQIVTFEEMFDHIKEDGVYLCEDCHSSYYYGHGGGYKRKGSFIEYTKNWIDYINAYHSRTNRLRVNSFTKHVKSLHYYDSIVVAEKGKVDPPVHSKTGTVSFVNEPKPASLTQKAKVFSNKVLGALNLPYYFD